MLSSTRPDIRFWFRGEIVSITGISPQKTVLRWLREDKQALGTKEGCGEGDCGACTVAVGTLDAGAPQGLRLKAVNSCLLFLPALDGKALFTVEDVAVANELHPVQRALVDLHASQCGFCTPGFVMSLWADYQERNGPPSRAEVNGVLSGNLCRCTGYRPIIEAAAAAWDNPVVKLDRTPVTSALASLADLPPLVYEHGQVWSAPRTVDGLAAWTEAHPEARIVAGATDVGLWVTKGLRDLGDLVSVGAVEELQRISAEGTGVFIGAAVSLTEAFRALIERYPELTELADRFASTPVRNSGTLVGNVANGSPIGDSLPVLLALGTSVILRKGKQERQVLLDDYYLGYQKSVREPGEVIVGLRVSGRPLGSTFRAWKISKRRDQDISAVCGAFHLTFDGRDRVAWARVAFGGMAAIPSRAAATEKALVGQPFDLASLEQARKALAVDFSPLTDGRATADYRRVVAQNLLTRLHDELSRGVLVP